MIVCDDGSTDGSGSVIESYIERDSRIKLIRKDNGGQASAWNVAYQKSEGQLISILDSDDIFYPTKLEKVADAKKLSMLAEADGRKAILLAEAEGLREKVQAQGLINVPKIS